MNRWILKTGFGLFLQAMPGKAAELRVESPEGCLDAQAVSEAVERLLQSPLSKVEGARFDVVVTFQESKWRVRIEYWLPGAAEQRTRVIDGSSCAEAGEAAAIAIAMAIAPQGSEEAFESGRFEEPADGSASGLRREADLGAALTQRAHRGTRSDTESPPAFPPQLLLGVAGIFDAGALPETTPGAGLEIGIVLPRIRFAAVGGLFAPRRRFSSRERGGDFRLALVGARACLTHTLGNWLLLGCGGFELGALQGDGVGVAQRYSRVQPWRAVVLEAGAVSELTGRVGLCLRVGSAIPLIRSDFLLDNQELVHRPAAATLRGWLGLEILL